MRVLIDTCVLLDILQKREPFFKPSQEVLRASVIDKFEGYISSSSMKDIYYMLHKATHDNTACTRALIALTDFLGMLDTYGEDVFAAFSSPISDFEDAVLEATAIRYKLDYIVTRNLADFEKSRIKAVSPENFLGILDGNEEHTKRPFKYDF